MEHSKSKPTILNSAMTNCILGIREKPDIGSISGILDTFDIVTSRLMFTSKFSNTDEFSGTLYTDEDDIIWRQVKGCGNLFRYPGGMIIYHIKNQLLFDCASLQYYMKNNLLPIHYTDISEDLLYKIARTDGTEHKCIIDNTHSIRMSRERGVYVIGLNFNRDKNDPAIRTSTELIKYVTLPDFMALNEIGKIKFTIPYIDETVYNLDECDVNKPLALMLINYFNRHIDIYIQKIKSNCYEVVTETDCNSITMTSRAKYLADLGTEVLADHLN